jgi:hypothetical protein
MLSKRERERLLQRERERLLQDAPKIIAEKQPRTPVLAKLPSRKSASRQESGAPKERPFSARSSNRQVKQPVNYFPSTEVDDEFQRESPPPQTPHTEESSAYMPTRPKKERTNFPGLREFSLMVCGKVQEKQRTTYNEVADELVNDLGHNFGTVPIARSVLRVLQLTLTLNHAVSSESDFDGLEQHKQDFTHACSDRVGQMEQKNIRRRVYDALNVLMALDIIRKNRDGAKQITWQGQKTPSPHCHAPLLIIVKNSTAAQFLGMEQYPASAPMFEMQVVLSCRAIHPATFSHAAASHIAAFERGAIYY